MTFINFDRAGKIKLASPNFAKQKDLEIVGDSPDGAPNTS